MEKFYTPLSVDSVSDPDKTDRFLVICPECNRAITPIRACVPPTLEACMTYKHLCIHASGIWRWCGEFGSLHIEVFKAVELKPIFYGDTEK